MIEIYGILKDKNIFKILYHTFPLWWCSTPSAGVKQPPTDTVTLWNHESRETEIFSVFFLPGTCHSNEKANTDPKDLINKSQLVYTFIRGNVKETHDT